MVVNSASEELARYTQESLDLANAVHLALINVVYKNDRELLPAAQGYSTAIVGTLRDMRGEVIDYREGSESVQSGIGRLERQIKLDFQRRGASNFMWLRANRLILGKEISPRTVELMYGLRKGPSPLRLIRGNMRMIQDTYDASEPGLLDRLKGRWL